MSEWDGVEGFESWNQKLRTLLDDAAKAAKRTEPEARFVMSERLIAFVENSFPNEDKIKALDEIASKAAVGLLEQNIDERLKSIVARNAELALVAKQFGSAADDVNASAADIRLERVKKTLDVLNSGVTTLKDLRSSLKQGSDKQLIASIDKAMSAAQAVRTLLEKA
jgi:predicted TIM-barrel enzyme